MTTRFGYLIAYTIPDIDKVLYHFTLFKKMDIEALFPEMVCSDEAKILWIESVQSTEPW